jgi:UDP-N-acetylglucosamine diphosphorylase/glucosamine-1-phosphate N-acetyltransferase
MRLCIFEDPAVPLLQPLTLTRPAFDLWCGAATLWQRQQRATAANEIGALVRTALVDLCRLEHPDFAVNDSAWLQAGATVFVNARWLPAGKVEDINSPRVGLVDDQVAYVILPAPAGGDVLPETMDDWIESCKQTLPHCPAGGVMIQYPWDLIENNARMLAEDATWFAQEKPLQHASATMLGPAQQFMVHAEAQLEPLVLADTRNGPVIIDRGAVVQSFSRLEGPCYVGPESHVVGAKLRGGSIGPCCRVGGEVESSILQGFANKYHDGFLGHSYLGEWTNIGAGTQVSDLRNDYGPIRVFIKGERVATGLTKVGVFLGDHTKTGLGTLLNSGTLAGAFCNLLPSGSFLPPVIPSFCTIRHGQLQECADLRQLFNTAATVVRRRGRQLTGSHIDFFFNLFDETAAERKKAVRDTELRRWRRSV